MRMRDEVLEVEGCGEEIIKVVRDDLKDRVMVVDFGESIELSISGGGNKKGKLVIKDSSIVPIMSKGKGIGTAIVKIDYK